MKATFSAVRAQYAFALLISFAWPSSVFAATDPKALLAQQERQRPRPVVATVQGRVFDATSHAPIGGAAVKWSRGGQEHVGSTDAKGMFSSEIPISERRRDKGERQEHGEAGDIVLSITANLFRGERQRLPIHAGATSRVDIGLEPRPANEIGTIQGTVTDADNGKPIANATVSILDAMTGLETTTDPNGDYRIGGVGYDQSLRLRITTRDPPCLAHVEKRIALDKPVLHLNIAATPLKLPVVHCPLNVTGPASGGPANLAADPSIQWHQADVLAIQMDVNADAWNAGHVSDVIRFEPGGGLLVATDTGGVWAITDIAQAIPVSDTWPSTSMFALALGPDGPRHVYAGTWPHGSSQGGVLMETDTSSTFPVLNWKPVNPTPPCGQINRILVIAEARRIVLACDSGLYWSAIPPKPSVAGTYSWIDATPANVQQGRSFSGLAKGPGWTQGGGEGTIAAAKWSGYAPYTAIYSGGWSGGALQLASSYVDQGAGNLFLGVGRTSIASCPADPTTMYGVAEDGQDNMAGTWRSTDGGAHWSQVAMPPNPGGQGHYNNAIAVSGDCRIVALGWESGTFVSYDGGGSWTLLMGGGHLHSDVHGLTFDPSDPTSLFIGSDGGVASVAALSPGGSPTFRSNWNRQLFEMQFYHGAASSAAIGLVAGGLQDNGVIYSGLPGPWLHVTDCGCDGRWSIFLVPPEIGAGGSILLLEETGAPDWPFSWVKANGNAIAYNAQQGVPVSPPNPPVLTNVVTMPVRFPGGYANESGQPLLAAGGVGSTVYGMFGNSDGSNLHWEQLGQIGANQNVSAISPTYNGQSIFVGTDAGNIYQLDAPFTGQPVQLTVNLPPGAGGSSAVNGLVGFFSTVAYAILNIGGSGYVMAWDGNSWNALGGTLPSTLPFGAIAAADLNTIFVATSIGVYDTHDSGTTWSQASAGLPAQLGAGSELRIVTEPSGATYVYLATFGRSLWRAQLP